MKSREIIKLEQQRELLIKQANQLRMRLREAGEEYEGFFRKRDEASFKLYKRLPNIEGLKAYLQFCDRKDKCGYDNSHHPLDREKYQGTFSYFDLEELATLLKTTYQLQTGKECGIVTTGNMVEIPGLCNVYPKLHYLIGTNSQIDPYREHNGIFYEEMNKFTFDVPSTGLICIPMVASEKLFEGQKSNRSIPENFYGRTMQYFEYKTIGQDATAYFNRFNNILKEDLKYSINDIASHRDIFTFPIAQADDFISKLLMSIMIYKKNNNIVELAEEDYSTIIHSIYGEPIDIEKEVDQTIPKKLVYIKSQESRDQYKDQLL